MLRIKTVKAMVAWMKAKRDLAGQGLVEYGLVIGLIAVVCIIALETTGTAVNGLLQKVARSLSTVS